VFTIRPRRAWGARPIAVVYQRPQDVHTLVLHHTVGAPAYTMSAAIDELKSIERFHMDVRGWNGPGYNAIVDRRGRVWEARGLNVVGAGATSHNRGYFHVALMGNYETLKPTLRQQAAIRALRLRLRAKGFRITRMVGHNQLPGHRANACPGRNNTKAFNL